MKPQKEEAGTCSRRTMLAGSALLLTGGGITGRISNAYSAPVPI
jgi:hypothetical protein